MISGTLISSSLEWNWEFGKLDNLVSCIDIDFLVGSSKTTLLAQDDRFGSDFARFLKRDGDNVEFCLVMGFNLTGALALEVDVYDRP